MERNLTQGKIGKSLLLFSFPMILGNLLQQIYNIADTLIVGRTIGAKALSAVGSSYALMVLLTSVILGLCMGSGVVFAQAYGAGNIEGMKVRIINALLFIGIFTIGIYLLSVCLLEYFIKGIHVPIEAVQDTRIYLKIIFLGMIFVAIYNFVANILRSIGNTIVPLVFLGISSALNILLDFMLILKFHMGVAGAAWATVIAQAFSAICISIYFIKEEKKYCPRREHMKIKRKILYDIVNQSSLTAIQQSIMNFGILMVQSLVNSFGFEASAAFAAVVKIDAFAYMPAQDFGNAFATFVAQNFGANQRIRIQEGLKIALKISCSFCLVASAFVVIFADVLMKLFIQASEKRIINIGVQYLYIEGAFYIGIGILFLLYALYRGMGMAWMSIVLTVISLGIRVVLAYGLASIQGVGLLGIWWAVPIGWGLADVIGMVYYRKKIKIKYGGAL